jgi:hypothetical protein
VNVGLLTIDGILIVIAAWLCIGLAGIAALRNFKIVARILFPLSAAVSVALAALGLAGLPDTPQVAILAIGLPDLPFHLRLDALSSFFLLLLGLASAGSRFRERLRRGGEAPHEAHLPPVPHLPRRDGPGARRRRRLRVHGELGDDGALVVLPGHHQPPHPRDPRAGTSACSSRTSAPSRSFSASACRRIRATTPSRTCARHLALLVLVRLPAGTLGFSAKAGVLPLHVWLPEARRPPRRYRR